MRVEDYTITVALCLCGDKLYPEVITKEIGIDPSYSRRKGEKWLVGENKEYESRRKGEKWLTRTNRERESQNGVWKLAAKSDSLQLGDHIMQLASILPMHSDALTKLPGVDEAYVGISMAADDAFNHKRKLDREEIEAEFGPYTSHIGGSFVFELSKEHLEALERIDLPVRWVFTLDEELNFPSPKLDWVYSK